MPHRVQIFQFSWNLSRRTETEESVNNFASFFFCCLSSSFVVYLLASFFFCCLSFSFVVYLLLFFFCCLSSCFFLLLLSIFLLPSSFVVYLLLLLSIFLLPSSFVVYLLLLLWSIFFFCCLSSCFLLLLLSIFFFCGLSSCFLLLLSSTFFFCCLSSCFLLLLLSISLHPKRAIFVESARVLLFCCVLLHWWVHFPRSAHISLYLFYWDWGMLSVTKYIHVFFSSVFLWELLAELNLDVSSPGRPPMSQRVELGRAWSHSSTSCRVLW